MCSLSKKGLTIKDDFINDLSICVDQNTCKIVLKTINHPSELEWLSSVGFLNHDPAGILAKDDGAATGDTGTGSPADILSTVCTALKEHDPAVRVCSTNEAVGGIPNDTNTEAFRIHRNQFLIGSESSDPTERNLPFCRAAIWIINQAMGVTYRFLVKVDN
jgi:hypothetical protein